jgi:hypothetical protein
MTSKTRYFVIASLLVIGVGLGTGLVAYYVGFPAGAFAARGGPRNSNMSRATPPSSRIADVRDVMTSESRQRLRSALPMPENGQRELEEKTGINIESDIDSHRRLPLSGARRHQPRRHGAGARPLRRRQRLKRLMREHGAHVEDYKTKRLIVSDEIHGKDGRSRSAFVESGFVALGSANVVRTSVDLHQAGNDPQAGIESVTGNEELMNLVRSLETATRGRSAGSMR